MKQMMRNKIEESKKQNRLPRRNLSLLMLILLISLMPFAAGGCITVQQAPETEAAEQSDDAAADQSGNSSAEQNDNTSVEQSNNVAAEQSVGTEAQSGGQGLSEEEIITIVTERVPGSTKDDIISFSGEYDDGVLEYEGKLMYDNVVYEFEVDGQTGNILEWEIDD